jgi:hypothetical protein
MMKNDFQCIDMLIKVCYGRDVSMFAALLGTIENDEKLHFFIDMLIKKDGKSCWGGG